MSLQSRAPLPLDATAPGSRLAVVHDWCPHFRGGERVLAELCAAFDARQVYTLFEFLDDDIKRRYFPAVSFHTSPADRLPWVERYYRWLFVVAPFLIEQFDVTGYDAVVSSSAAFARGVLTRADQPHLCYVHSPVRYAWDEQFSYLDQAGLGYGPKGLLFRYALHRLRSWDVRTAHGPDLMVANSTLVRRRIARTYGRDADVVFPPLALDELSAAADKDDYYVTASFLAPYKRTDLVVRAFNDLPGRRLVVVGDGQQSAALRRLAGANVTFAGFVPRAEYVAILSRARAMVFAGCEDFGIALAEAQACGTPLVALGRGGACDIVRPLGEHADPTGVLFPTQSAGAVADAVATFEANRDRIRPSSCHENALRFAADRFRREMQAALAKTFELHARSGR
jgi:glycosyltransferase involved in cell wall biosynthesis